MVSVRETPVLIAGGGPVGLALAADLGLAWHRVPPGRANRRPDQHAQDERGESPNHGILPPLGHRRQGDELSVS